MQRVNATEIQKAVVDPEVQHVGSAGISAGLSAKAPDERPMEPPRTAGQVNCLLKKASFWSGLSGGPAMRPIALADPSAAGPAPAIMPNDVAAITRRLQALSKQMGYRGAQRSYPEKLTDATGLSAAAAALKGLTHADSDVLNSEPNPIRRLGLRLNTAKAALQGAQARTTTDRNTESGLRAARADILGRQGAMLGLTSRGGDPEVPGNTMSPPSSAVHEGDVLAVPAGAGEVLVRRSTGQPVLRTSSGSFFSPIPGTAEHNSAVAAMEALSPHQIHQIKTQLGQRSDSPINRVVASLATLNNDPRFHVLSMLGPLALNFIPAGAGKSAADTPIGKAFRYGTMGTQIAAMLSGAGTRAAGSGLGRNFTAGTSGV